jgi:hypothetical protein
VKSKAKQRYHNESGKIIVGTTTVTGLLAKPPLYNWYWNLGRDGINHRKHLDHLAEIGTLMHSMIFHYLKDETIDTGDYSQNQIASAMNGFELFRKWGKQHKLEPILLEEQLVSEKWEYGGTPDFYGLVDGEKTLLDFKSSGVYSDQFIQLAAYKNLLEEQGHKVDNCWVLVLPTDKELKEAQREDVSDHWETFTHLLEVYRLLKKIGR